MRKLVLTLGLLPIIALAAPLQDFQFKSPSFNGNGYGTYVLTIQNEEYTRQQAIQQALEAAKAQAKADAASKPLNQFLVNLESRAPPYPHWPVRKLSKKRCGPARQNKY